MKGYKYFKIAFYIAIWLLVFYKGISFIDPDFGWHIATGNLILKSGFPKTDPFSYTMPSFPFVEHEWLVDILFAKLYPLTGLTGLSVLFSSIFLFAVFITVSGQTRLRTVLFLIGISALLPFFTVSPKVVSWLLLSFFIFAVFNEKFWKKYWLSIPAIVVLWANLHGSFPLALVILSVLVICKSFREKHVWFKGVLVTILSFLATLVNPFGAKLWWIVWLTLSDPLQKFRVLEWAPAYYNPFAFTFLTLLLLTISMIFISKYRHKFKIEKILINLLFFTMTVFAIRNITLWVLVDLPVVAAAVDYFFKENWKSKIGQKKSTIISRGLIIFVGAVFIIQGLGFVFLYQNTHKESVFYPEGAVSYLKKNLPTDQIFSEYNWGGYLIWKLPEKKVFIYGMMPIWRRALDIPGESKDAMNDSFGMQTGENPYEVIFTKYDIDEALLSLPQAENPARRFAENAMSVFGIEGNVSQTDPLYEKLKISGWVQVYKDKTSVILKKPSSGDH
ncbi:MAG TPA: hypothetical protein VMR19_03005 [Candidatus Saccharimonadales bacterium]|jgi:hypothetical protein|nr:hypothetical protein [Candidatus Saccharimonadales bacterium]